LLSESVKKKVLDFADSLKCPILIRDPEMLEIGESDITLRFSDGLKFFYAWHNEIYQENDNIKVKGKIIMTKTKPGE